MFLDSPVYLGNITNSKNGDVRALSVSVLCPGVFFLVSVFYSALIKKTFIPSPGNLSFTAAIIFFIASFLSSST